MTGTVLSPLITRLKRSEGWRDKVYLDSANPPNVTIGYGHNLGRLILPAGVTRKQVRLVPVNGISEAIGEMLLFSDVAAAMHTLSTRLPWFDAMDDVRREVLVELVFNIGPDVLTYDVFMSQLKARQYADAAENMRSWKGWYPVVHAARAEPLCRMMASGVRE